MDVSKHHHRLAAFEFLKRLQRINKAEIHLLFFSHYETTTQRETREESNVDVALAPAAPPSSGGSGDCVHQERQPTAQQRGLRRPLHAARHDPARAATLGARGSRGRRGAGGPANVDGARAAAISVIFVYVLAM